MSNYRGMIPEGTRDLLFEESLARRRVEKALSGVFEMRSYNEVLTPGIEYYEAINISNNSSMGDSMYKLIDNKGKILVLRPDSTVPIARLTATRLKGEQPPFRLFYRQSVYRFNQSLRGRNNEVAQAGIEFIGAEGNNADLEVLSIAAECLNKCDVNNFKIEIGHIGFFNEILKSLNVSKDEKEKIKQLTESKNYAALKDLLSKEETSKANTALQMLPRLFGGIEVIGEARELFENEETNKILDYIKSIYEDLCKLGLKNNISIDLGIVQQNDYYTGLVFKGYIEEWGNFVISGGRYDNLIKEFNRDLPAVGFAIDIDAVAKTMLTKIKHEKKTADVLVVASEGFVPQAIVEMNKLIDDGTKCEMSQTSYVDSAKAYARKMGIKKLLIVGKKTVIINVD